MGLDVPLVNGYGVELALDHEVGSGEAGLHVSLDLPEVLSDVALPFSRLSHLGGAESFVQDGSAVGHALGGGQDGTEHLVLDDDLVGGLFGDVRARGGNGGDGVALVQGLVVGEHVVAEVAEVCRALSERDDLVGHFRQVRAGDDGEHAVHGLGLTRVYRQDSCVGVGTANELCVEKVVRVEVRAVLGASGHLVGPVVTDGPRSDDLVVAVLEDHVGFVCGGHSKTSLICGIKSPESVRASWYQGNGRATISCRTAAEPGLSTLTLALSHDGRGG